VVRKRPAFHSDWLQSNKHNRLLLCGLYRYIGHTWMRKLVPGLL